MRLSKMNTNQLRDLAVELGADRKKLYGTSKAALIHIVFQLQREKERDEELGAAMTDDEAMDWAFSKED